MLQTSDIQLALRDTQTRLYALDTTRVNDEFSIDDSFNLARLKVQDVAMKGALRYMVSTYDFRDNVLRDYEEGEGRRVVTFNNILRHRVLPLAEALDFMLTTGQKAMSRPVEIEFAGMIDYSRPGKGRLYWLQIRPIVERKETVDSRIMETPDDKLLLKSDTALGHGTYENVRSVVYVRPEKFSSSNNSLISREIEKINRNFTARGENYILIGPGRWGSSDTALGIPVKWPAISAARLIVESSLPNYRIEPSQGTHFFQNLTSFGVGYFTVDTAAGKGIYDVGFLDSLPAETETDFVRVVSFSDPLVIGINGLKSKGVVVKPDIVNDRESLKNSN